MALQGNYTVKYRSENEIDGCLLNNKGYILLQFGKVEVSGNMLVFIQRYSPKNKIIGIIDLSCSTVVFKNE